MWNDVLQVHAKLFYTEEVLVRNGIIKDAEGFRNAVFEEYHRRGNRLLSEPTIKRLFARYGVSDEDFDTTWSSFEVAQKLRVASDLARRYSISSVPAIVVNGKYRTGGSEAGSYPKMLEVIDELIVRESAR
jgi:thiol:disulfide interchange protein DsbA